MLLFLCTYAKNIYQLQAVAYSTSSTEAESMNLH